MYRQQFDSGNAEFFQITHAGRMRQPGIGAAQLFRNFGIQLTEALYVDFVDYRITQGSTRWTVLLPVKEAAYHDAFGHAGRTISLIKLQVRIFAAEWVAKDVMLPIHLTCNCLGIRIDEQLAGIKAQPFFGTKG